MMRDHTTPSWHSFSLIAIGSVLLQSTVLSAQIYQARADTGRMAWGHTEYTRYTGAAYCDRAVVEVFTDHHRVYVPDTSVDSHRTAHDTVLPAPVIAAARACGDRLTVESAHPRDLWPLVRLLLVRGDDAQAKAAIERAISLQPTSQDSAATMQKAIISLLATIPARVSLADAYVTRLDALEGNSKVTQMAAHLAFAEHWYTLYHTDRLREHAERAIAIWNTMNLDEKNNGEIVAAYDYLMNLANDAGDLDVQGKLVGQAGADGIGTWRGNDGEGWVRHIMGVIALRREMYGKQARSLEGTFWFNHQGVPRPAPGKMSLVVRIDRSPWTRGFESFQFYEMITSFKAKYGAELDVTFITATAGRLPGSGPLTPAEEAEGIARTLVTLLRLPVVVLVDETHVDTLSDGRLQRGGSRLDGLFPDNINAFLTDREGKMLWLGYLRGDRTDRRVLDAVVGRTARVTAGPTTTDTSRLMHP